MVLVKDNMENSPSTEIMERECHAVIAESRICRLTRAFHQPRPSLGPIEEKLQRQHQKKKKNKALPQRCQPLGREANRSQRGDRETERGRREVATAVQPEGAA